MLLKDRISIVTGGSSGVGRGIALEFTREGARVAIADKQEAPLRGKYHEKNVTTPTAEEIEKLGGRAIFIQTDVSDESQVERLIQRTVQHFGGLDILVNNAGIHIPGGAQDISIAQWDKVVGTNLRAVFVATKLAIPHLKQSKYGRIIQIASVPRIRRRRGTCLCPGESRGCQHGARYRDGGRRFRDNRQRHLPRLHRDGASGLPHAGNNRCRSRKGPPCRALENRETSGEPPCSSPPTMRNGLPAPPCSLMAG